MEISRLIFILISLSTYSLTTASFLSCNETKHSDYKICQVENSSVVVQIHREIDKSTSEVVRTDLEFYPETSWRCGTPEIITVTNDSFRDLQRVRSISMECVQFRGAPNPFVMQRSLEKLAFLFNQFTEFPNEFCAGIPYLDTIDVDSQNIQKISKDSLSNVTAYLKDLRLHRIQLRNIEPGTFIRFRYLKSLSCRANRLEILRRDMFLGLNSLETLDFTGNIIRTIEPGAFDNLTTLRRLVLNWNRLMILPDTIFSNLHNLEHLWLVGNPIKTDISVLFKGLDKLQDYSWGREDSIKITNKQKDMPLLWKIWTLFTPIGWAVNAIRERVIEE